MSCCNKRHRRCIRPAGSCTPRTCWHPAAGRPTTPSSLRCRSSPRRSSYSRSTHRHRNTGCPGGYSSRPSKCPFRCKTARRCSSCRSTRCSLGTCHSCYTCRDWCTSYWMNFCKECPPIRDSSGTFRFRCTCPGRSIGCSSYSRRPCPTTCWRSCRHRKRTYRLYTGCHRCIGCPGNTPGTPRMPNNTAHRPSMDYRCA